VVPFILTPHLHDVLHHTLELERQIKLLLTNGFKQVHVAAALRYTQAVRVLESAFLQKQLWLPNVLYNGNRDQLHLLRLAERGVLSACRLGTGTNDETLTTTEDQGIKPKSATEIQ
jgi:hypothetical protein